MNISQQGVDFIKLHEGCRLTAYEDTGGVWTIGFGTTGSGIAKGLRITDKQAEDFLRRDLTAAEKCVNNSVRVDMSQSMFDALVSFVYNVGCGAFGKSTLLRKLNSGYDDDEVAKEFLRWIYDNGKIIAGLRTRRKDEQELFLS